MSQDTPTMERTDDKFGLDRIVFFSDAVVAIAITLLVLELKVPELPKSASDDQLAAAIWSLVPKFVGYFTSFWVIGLYWLAHHRLFRVIVRYDHTLLLVNLLFLFFIAFVPFPTALLYSFPGRTIAVELYCATIVLSGFTSSAMIYYAAREHRLVGPAYTWVKAETAIKRSLVPPIVFLLSMVIAPINGDFAMNSWSILLVYYLIIAPRRRERDW